MTDTKKPSFDFSDLQLRRSSGKEYTVCPVCSPHRKKKSAPCVTVNHETGKANCHHCGAWGVREFSSRSRSLVDPATLSPPRPIKAISDHSFIPRQIVDSSLRAYEQNTLFNALVDRWGLHHGIDSVDVSDMFRSYRIGTASKGRAVIPIIDIEGRVRAIQTKAFDSEGKTVSGTTSFAHHEIAKSMRKRGSNDDWYQRYINDTPPHGLFGGHRLSEDPSSVVNLVEAPKTAVISSLIIGGLWCATISKGGFSATNCNDLKGSKVVIWADVDALDEWEEKAERIAKVVGFTYSISRWADYFKGLGATDDIADLILRGKAEPIEEITPPQRETDRIMGEWSQENPAIKDLCDRLGLKAVGWAVR